MECEHIYYVDQNGSLLGSKPKRELWCIKCGDTLHLSFKQIFERGLKITYKQTNKNSSDQN